MSVRCMMNFTCLWKSCMWISGYFEIELLIWLYSYQYHNAMRYTVFLHFVHSVMGPFCANAFPVCSFIGSPPIVKCMDLIFVL